MELTKENFIKFCRSIVKNGMSFDLECYGENICFGYFELKPYANESTIRYNVESISKNEDEIKLSCSVRIREFYIGNAIITEESFLRYAKNVRLYGNFDDDVMNIIASL